VTQKYEGLKKAGRFTISSDIEVHGELCLDGEATSLDLYSESSFDRHAIIDVSGSLFGGEKVSLINCVSMSSSIESKGNSSHHRASVFPHFAIFGDQHISSTCQIIRRLSFTIDDAATVFYDFDIFGSVVNAKPYLEKVVESKEMLGDRRIDIGEFPHLFYFTGKHEIFEVDTDLGTISATNSLSYASPSTEGIHVENKIRINIGFNVEKTVDEAIRSVLDVARFLGILAGRPQNISDLVFASAGAEDYVHPLDVYWCVPPSRNRSNESSKPHPYDLPLQVAVNPDEFSNVLKLWIERNDQWRDARTRFSTAFSHQSKYTIDRIVGAANMFDILPSNVYPSSIALTDDIAEAKENARKIFRDLPHSLERDSILNALGRLGNLTLKRKVRSRASLISSRPSYRLPKLLCSWVGYKDQLQPALCSNLFFY
jgi:ApeA N-terminal domain 1